MMKLARKLKHYLQTKIYHAWLNVSRELERNSIIEIKKKIHCNPDKINFGGIPDEFNGGQYMYVGDGTFFSVHLSMNATDSYPTDEDNVIVIQKMNPLLEIGENCAFGAYNHITCTNHISIGSNLLTGRWVTITDNSHGGRSAEDMAVSPSRRKIYSKGKVIIGDNVWIGDKASILPNVRIGNNVIVGANSVVTKDVPSYCIVAGNPAKVIKQHFCQVLD